MSGSYETPSTPHLPKGTALFTSARRNWPLFIQLFSLSFCHISLFLVEVFVRASFINSLFPFSHMHTCTHTHVFLSVCRPLIEKSLMFVIIAWRVGVWPRPAVPHKMLHFMCQDERFKENWTQNLSHRASEPFYSSRMYCDETVFGINDTRLKSKSVFAEYHHICSACSWENSLHLCNSLFIHYLVEKNSLVRYVLNQHMTSTWPA